MSASTSRRISEARVGLLVSGAGLSSVGAGEGSDFCVVFADDEFGCDMFESRRVIEEGELSVFEWVKFVVNEGV